MSDINTERWLEAAQDSFDHCVEVGDYHGVLAVISDVRNAGYLEQSQTMRELLRAVPLHRFARKSEFEY